ncbi:MAG: hypothetical protein J5847_03365 [Clostridia bacterium]|nr:hypothetical protein [Clostridia bacterium]
MHRPHETLVQEEPLMLTLDSKVKALKKSPEATAIIVKYSPGIATDPQMKLVQGLTMRKLLSFPQAGLSEEEVAALEKELLDAQIEG